MNRKTWIRILITTGLVVAASAVAFDFDPRDWFDLELGR